MKRGTKVRITGIVTDRGTRLDSISDLHESRAVGTVEVGPDEVGFCLVSFEGVGKPLEIPANLLSSAR